MKLLHMYIVFFLFFGTHEAFNHLVSFSVKERDISQSGIESPTTLFGLGTPPLSSGSLGSS